MPTRLHYELCYRVIRTFYGKRCAAYHHNPFWQSRMLESLALARQFWPSEYAGAQLSYWSRS